MGGSVNTKTGFSITLGFRDSFNGFKKLWIIFCALGVVILFMESYLPKIIINSVSNTKYIKPYIKAFSQFKSEVLSIDKASEAFINFKYELIRITGTVLGRTGFYVMLSKVITAFVVIIFVLCLLYIIMIIFSKYSVWADKSDVHLKRSLKRSPLVSLSYFVISFFKAVPFSISMAAPLLYLIIRTVYADPAAGSANGGFNIGLNFVYIVEFLLILLFSLTGFVSSVFIYVRLYFTGFIITEESANPFAAMKKSWRLTRPYSYKIFLLFLITFAGDIISALTIVCFIPWTGVKYTVRASVYQQILKQLTVDS